MNFYLVDKIGDGKTIASGFRPNTPEAPCSCILINDQFLVGTKEMLAETLVADLQGFCKEIGLLYEDIMKWSVGDTQ